MQKRLVAASMLLIACSATQRTPVAPPSVYNGDAGSIAVVDQDAYNITLPSAADVSIHLPVVDGAGPSGEIIAPLRTGSPAPFNGVLFNGPAVARIEVEFRGQAAQCRIDRQTDIERMRAMAVRDIGLLNVTIHSQDQVYNLMLRSRDQEITRLYNYIQANNNPPINLWPYVGLSLGGLVLGAGVMSAFFLLRP